MYWQKLLRWSDRHRWLSVIIVLAGFVGLALGNISRWAIWFDEGYTSYLMRFNYGEIFSLTAHDVHPPLYYWVLHTWTLIWGNNEFALRSLSTVFMVVALLGVYVLVKYITRSHLKALFSLFLLSILPMAIHYADEARMYSMAAAIVVWATYVLLRAEHEKSKKWWILYAVLVAAGMYTHYYTALAWLAHWVWRFGEKRAGRIKQFWTGEWLLVHIAAVASYVFWLPFFVVQIGVVQSGFWIGPITGATIPNYVGDIFLSFGGDRLIGWWALAAMFIIGFIITSIAKARLWKATSNKPSAERLIMSLAFVPPVLLILVSMPPVRPTFVDRYILYAVLMLVVAVSLSVSAVQLRNIRWRIAVGVLVVLCALGVMNLYQYGAIYNKKTNFATRTREIVREINQTDSSNTPIIAPVKWTYYEAAPYETASHPVYTIDDGRYQWGSLLPIKRATFGKISDITGFAEDHRYIWYVVGSNEPPTPPDASWQTVRVISYEDPVAHTTNYYGALFDTHNK